MLTIRSGSCTGAVLGCNDDIVAGAEQASRLTVTLAAGQTVAIVVEGYGTNSGSFVLNASAGGVDAGGAGGVDAGGADPCGGVTIDGRCASTTLLEYCSIATGGGSQARLERISCGAGERCAVTADGIATCQLAVTCREGDEQCVGTTQLRRCVGGAWVTQTCPRECLSTPIGDLCSPNVAVRSVTGRVTYVARGPNGATRPTDWSATTFIAPAQSFLILSTRQNVDGTASIVDATTSSIGNADGGRFSIRVPTIVTSSDYIIVVAAAGDGAGGLRYIVANPSFASPGLQAVGTRPQLHSVEVGLADEHLRPGRHAHDHRGHGIGRRTHLRLPAFRLSVRSRSVRGRRLAAGGVVSIRNFLGLWKVHVAKPYDALRLCNLSG
ncbi:MAG: hypothetical protein IPF99_28845 [Deltaproteobacteria bacterium]|nr:hypothetical protein [Deltaproteobacteria bacterium]